MRLLVTGGAGFVGCNVVRNFLRRAEIELIVNLDCLTYAGSLENVADCATDPRYRFAKIDLREKSAVLRVFEEFDFTRVLHLAAESHVDRSIASPDAFMHTNVVGTLHLLEACRSKWRSGEDRLFVQVSTDEVYGSLGAEGRFTESSPYAPNSPYSASKAAADMFVRSYQRTYGLPAVVTNCCNNFGPFQHAEKLIPMIIHRALHEEPIPIYGTGQNVRDWIYVEDHAEALWLTLTTAKANAHYNIGANEEHTNMKVAEMICDIVDELRATVWLGGSLAPPPDRGRARDLITSAPDRPGHDWRYAIDSTRIRRQLGWQPRQHFKTALKETVRWYMDLIRSQSARVE